MDWWELPAVDLLPLLKQTGRIQVEIKDRNGTMGLLKMNNLQPPFDNPAIRRALLGAVVQKDFVSAIAGDDPAMWRTGVGIFTPGTEMASDAGMDVLNGPRDLDAVRAAIRQAGYHGEKTVLIAPSDPPFRKAMADVAGPMLVSAGLNVEVQSMDWVPRSSGGKASCRWTRVAGACCAPRPTAWTCKLQPCISCVPQGSRPGSAGATALGSKRCAPPGSMPPILRRRNGLPPKFSFSAGLTSRIYRSVSGISRWRGRPRSPGCWTASRFSGACNGLDGPGGEDRAGVYFQTMRNRGRTKKNLRHWIGRDREASVGGRHRARNDKDGRVAAAAAGFPAVFVEPGRPGQPRGSLR